MPDHLLSEELLPNSQPDTPLTQFHVIPIGPVAVNREQRSVLYLSAPCEKLQAIMRPLSPQPCLGRTIIVTSASSTSLQTLHHLHSTPLDALVVLHSPVLKNKRKTNKNPHQNRVWTSNQSAVGTLLISCPGLGPSLYL